MNDAQLAILAAELTTSTHPTTTTYDVDAQLAADELNAENVTRIKATMTGFELMENTDATEYSALTADGKVQWLSLCGQDTVNPEAGGVIQDIVIDIFGGGSATVTALAAARQETVSQATALGLPLVNSLHVQSARGEI